MGIYSIPHRHSCIKFRQKVLGKQQSRYTAESCEDFSKELWLLKKLQTADKSFVPPLLKFQDRGSMVIMHHALLPFARSLFSYRKYQEQSANIFAEAHTQVLNDKELLSSFKAGIQPIPHSSSDADKFSDETVVCSVCRAIVVEMLNTINSDFLKSLSMLDKISSSKGTEAKLML